MANIARLLDGGDEEEKQSIEDFLMQLNVVEFRGPLISSEDDLFQNFFNGPSKLMDYKPTDTSNISIGSDYNFTVQDWDKSSSLDPKVVLNTYTQQNLIDCKFKKISSLKKTVTNDNHTIW